MRHIQLPIAVGLLFLAFRAGAQAEVVAVQNPATFTAIEQTVFTQRCTSCHMQMSAKEPAESGIDFMSYATMMASNQSTVNSILQ